MIGAGAYGKVRDASASTSLSLSQNKKQEEEVEIRVSMQHKASLDSGPIQAVQ